MKSFSPYSRPLLSSSPHSPQASDARANPPQPEPQKVAANLTEPEAREKVAGGAVLSRAKDGTPGSPTKTRQRPGGGARNFCPRGTRHPLSTKIIEELSAIRMMGFHWFRCSLAVLSASALAFLTPHLHAGAAAAVEPAPAAQATPASPNFFGIAQPSPADSGDAIDTKDIKIVSAKWGIGVSFQDVTVHVKAILDQPDTDFQADTDWLESDPASGLHKNLVTTVEWNDQQYILTTPEDGTISAGVVKKFLHDQQSAGQSSGAQPAPPDPRDIKILSATWGLGEQVADVTDQVSKILNSPKSEYPVDPDWLKGDPAPRFKKHLAITFEYQGKRYLFTAQEDTSVGLRELDRFIAGKQSPSK